ncbi:PepSY-associated TM helix domain-containing protein [Telmatobacter bradus]|uniref:PepSY-associated TM helix domain-containing protein n=1 Tax=Telmatobacter bradus TaxID=474953 RepID=UPI003B43664D
MLLQMHLWVGILAALYLTLMGLTGALLVFEDEFTQRSLPLSTAPTSTSQLRPAQALAAAQSSAPHTRCTFLSFPAEDLPFYRVWLRNSSGQQSVILVDAATGALHSGFHPWIETVHDLHVYLLLGPRGLVVNGLGATCLLLLALTGMILWWPGRARLRQAVRVKFSASWRRINHDLHNAVGFWCILFLFWWGISGVYFVWPAPFARAVDAVFSVRAMRPPAVPADQPGPGVSLDSIVAAARQAEPLGSISGVAPADKPGESTIVYVDTGRPGDFSHRAILYYGAATGRLLAVWHYGQNQTVGDWILWAMHPLHFGNLWGLGPKILWALAGLTLPLLSVTGLLMYWNRKLRSLLHRPR